MTAQPAARNIVDTTEPTAEPRLGTLVVRILTSTDHKVIGNLYLITNIFWFLAGGVMALLRLL